MPLVMVLASVTSVAAAEPGNADKASRAEATREINTDGCIESHTQSQVLRQEGKLLESRTALLSCSSAACPGAIRRDCGGWLEDVQAQIPSVGFRANVAGEARTDVEVFVDGKRVLERLQGKALELDPGVYRVRFVPQPPLEPVDQELVMSEGDRFRVVTVELEPPRGAAVPHIDKGPLVLQTPTPASVYIFAGIGAAAAISGAAWGLSSWAVTGELDASCAPGCDDKLVDVARRRALIADASWGLCAASLITATALYYLRPEAAPSDYAIDVALFEGGVLGSLEIATP